jgi:hypothetical protein
MKTKLKLALERHIDDWLNEIIENQDDILDRPDIIHDEIIEQMATAAAAVWDACRDSQEYYKHENPD